MILEKKTKIVATIGPKTEDEATLLGLAKAGLNVARLNLSHGDHAEHAARIKNLHKVMKKTGRPIGILLDLAGPKIRIGDLSTDTITLKPGKLFTLTTKKIIGDETKVFVNYPKLPQELKKGNEVLIQDGRKRLKVVKISGDEIICKIIVGGILGPRRGVNLPDTDLSIDVITPKDKEDLAFGVSQDVDFVALSFVRSADDIKKLRSLLKTHKSEAHIIAKIETPQAVRNIDEIIEAADGIMVARGDLAVEVPAQDVPLIQKMIIRKCNEAGKPVITATQMLESMIHSVVPTRAEVSDVANAILDGTDAVMLSEETTLGEHPIEAVKIMAKVALRVESDYLHEQTFTSRRQKARESGRSVTDAVTAAAVHTIEAIGTPHLVALSDSGFTARMIARYRSSRPIVVLTPNKKTWRRSTLVFGCYPVLTKQFQTITEVLTIVRNFFKNNGRGKAGEDVVLVCGWPFGSFPFTNTVLVERL